MRYQGAKSHADNLVKIVSERRATLVTVGVACGCLAFGATGAFGGDYRSSAHGNSSYGVNRSSTSTSGPLGIPGGYSRGNCVHCHEQHASIQGAEPSPVNSAPSDFALFAPNYVSQSDVFCFNCHTSSSTLQAVVNRSYSYRAGWWTSDTVNNIKSAFNPSSGSAHNLGDIQSFLGNDSDTTAWGYKALSNPCTGCHNPHAAQGDPANSPNATKSSGSRGWPLSRPSQHNSSPWPLWGNDSGEKMSDYTASYQAPYRYGSTTTYEPDGSTTTTGSNLADYNTFCTDCHNTTNTITSTTLGRPLKPINWVNGDKHGKASGDGTLSMRAPYNATVGKVLSCTDCHEPHGSPNKFLLRAEVNGMQLTGTVVTVDASTPSINDKTMGYLCRACHQDDSTANKWEDIHHKNGDYPYTQSACASCHSAGGNPPPPQNCLKCHYHGSSVTNARTPSNRVTF